MSVPEIPLKVGSFYYFEEDNIHPKRINRMLFQLRELPSERKQKEGTSIVFTVFHTNKENFCDPGLNIADISCTSKNSLFESHNARVMKEIFPKDFAKKKYRKFPLHRKKHYQGAARLFYHPYFTKYCPLDMLPLFMGEFNHCPRSMIEETTSIKDIINERLRLGGSYEEANKMDH